MAAARGLHAGRDLGGRVRYGAPEPVRGTAIRPQSSPSSVSRLCATTWVALNRSIERQALVGAVRVGLLDRAWAGAVEDDRHAGGGVVPGVGVERHAGRRDRLAHDPPGLPADHLDAGARCRRAASAARPAGCAGPRPAPRGRRAPPRRSAPAARPRPRPASSSGIMRRSRRKLMRSGTTLVLMPPVISPTVSCGEPMPAICETRAARPLRAA